MNYNCIFVIGPTAVGKTEIGVRLAASLGGEVLSADSRQVYRGLDIGSGKDLRDFKMNKNLALSLNPALKDKITDGFYNVPYHIIDVTDLSHEYSLFDFTADFYNSFADCQKRGALPVVVGGTGMYLDSILRNYDMIPFEEDKAERRNLESLSYEELKSILISEKEKLHNTSEFGDSGRIINAILLNRFTKSEEYKTLRKKVLSARPKVNPLVLGTTLPRPLVRERIAKRLHDRLEEGLVEEVQNLHENGASWQRLESLGLEYRFVSEYLQQKIESKEKLFELLNLAIGQFAKRQETWFKGMEKKGVKINWLPQEMPIDVRFEAALELVRQRLQQET
ncbi:tRNA (adenosine(37)-N6)-dimethylallyltransferase [Treponema sp. UBA7570]|uniref:tRNA (adenosine(37)-N6)-dimethylallyltransferase n=1 Tax=Treponema sp. UBA7570 TaxID=1947749 RepID=UPI0025F808D1|nr:tRNA (adenosine(37)-N6)-dimethylallyltransferase MiaA [Treponema sp. UBA7570]